jgi:pimeloyl-ACP methyl ester carboxylesterase
LPTTLARYGLALADEYGIGRFVFMGHSWGGSIGVHLGAEHADRVEKLVLLDAGYRDIDLAQSREDLVAAFEADQHGKIVARRPARVPAWALHSVSSEPISSAWGRLRIPVLLLLSSESDFDVEPFRRAVPLARIDVVESGHDVPEDAPDAVVALVTEWAG